MLSAGGQQRAAFPLVPQATALQADGSSKILAAGMILPLPCIFPACCQELALVGCP